MHQSLLADIKRIIDFDTRILNKENLSGPEKSLVDNTYQKIFGLKIKEKKCADCYLEAYIKLKKLYLTNLKNKTLMGQFSLQPGKNIKLHGFPTVYTNANITDEAAISILKKFPAALKFFQTYPSNWRHLCGFDSASDKQTPVGKKPVPVAVPATPVKEEPAGKSDKELLTENLENKSLEELKEIAKNMELPAKIYKKFGKNAMIAYLIPKILNSDKE